MTSDATPVGGKGSTFFQPAASAPAAVPKPLDLASRVQAVAGFDLATFMVADAESMERVIVGLIAALKNCPESEVEAGDLHEDGGYAIASQVAVWLVGQVSGAYGRKLLSLSNIKEPKRLRSTTGLSELLTTAIQDHLGTGGS